MPSFTPLSSTTILSVLAALGIHDLIKLFLGSHVEDWIEERRFGIKERKEARESLLNMLAMGKSNYYTTFPSKADIAHITKISFKIEAFDEKFAEEIGLFTLLWKFYQELTIKRHSSFRASKPEDQKAQIKLASSIQKRIAELHKILIPKINALAKKNKNKNFVRQITKWSQKHLKKIKLPPNGNS